MPAASECGDGEVRSMNNDSMRLVLAGGMIALLVLSAAAWRAVRGPIPAPAETGASQGRSGADAHLGSEPETPTREQSEAAFGEDAVPIFAEDPAAGPYLVALRIPEPIWGEKLFVCDGTGSPLEEIVPDRDGDQSVGPLTPGRYGVFCGGTEIGAFRLYGNASLGQTEGRLWTDGEVLYVERFVPGEARLTLRFSKPGYYSLRLCDQLGREWNRDLYIPESERPNRGSFYEKILEFRGLPAGRYTAVYRGTPVGQTEIRSGETSDLDLMLDK